MPLNGWSYLVATYDGTTLVMYLDGQQLGTATFAGALATTGTSFVIAGDVGCASCDPLWNGNLDDAAGYPTALSAAQVLNHFNQSGNMRPAAPTNVTATAGANQATISWTASVTSTGAAVQKYVVRSSQNSTAVAGSATASEIGSVL